MADAACIGHYPVAMPPDDTPETMPATDWPDPPTPQEWDQPLPLELLEVYPDSGRGAAADAAGRLIADSLDAF